MNKVGRQAGRQPPITYAAEPNVPTEEQAVARVQESTNVAGWSASEASSAASSARAAEAAEAAAAAELQATKDALAARQNVQMSKVASEAATQEGHAAEAAAISSRDIVEKIPGVAMQAAQDATKEVVAEAIARMEADAKAAADEAAARLKAAQMAAAKEATEAAQPFIDAKIRTEKNSIAWLTKARVASESATELMNEAMHVSGLAEAYQAANNPVIAQTVLNKGYDLMHKGKQMEAYATSAESKAGALRKLVSPYGKAIKAAVKYGAYQGNPAGKPPPLPPLPAPLVMPGR